MVLSGRRYRFRPGVAATLAAAAVIATTGLLGRWQLHRAAFKQQLQDEYAMRALQPPLHLLPDRPASADALHYRRVEASGTFDPRWDLLVDNKSLGERVGYHAFGLLVMDGSNRGVLVDRGWLPRTAAYPEPPPTRLPAGHVVLSGIADNPNPRYVELSGEVVDGRVWQNISVDRFRARSGRDVLPILLVQQSDTGDGLTRAWSAPDTGIATHRGYALQWFALSATALVFWAVTSFSRETTNA